MLVWGMNMEELDFFTTDKTRFDYFTKKKLTEETVAWMVNQLFQGSYEESFFEFINEYREYVELPKANFKDKSIALSWNKLNEALFSLADFLTKEKAEFILDPRETKSEQESYYILNPSKKNLTKNREKLQKIGEAIKTNYHSFLSNAGKKWVPQPKIDINIDERTGVYRIDTDGKKLTYRCLSPQSEIFKTVLYLARSSTPIKTRELAERSRQYTRTVRDAIKRFNNNFRKYLKVNHDLVRTIKDDSVSYQYFIERDKYNII